jgi:hypothetical protein
MHSGIDSWLDVTDVYTRNPTMSTTIQSKMFLIYTIVSTWTPTRPIRRRLSQLSIEDVPLPFDNHAQLS